MLFSLIGIIGLFLGIDKMVASRNPTSFQRIYPGNRWALLVILVLFVCQLIMLMAPIKDAGPGDFKKRNIWTTIIFTSLSLALLAAAVVCCICVTLIGDKRDPIVFLGTIGFVTSWIFWALVFRKHFEQSVNVRKTVHGCSRMLFAGSILEWIVALGSHMVVRWRGDCSSPVVTAVALSLGTAIAFLSFGPGLFYYFLERKARMTPRNKL